MPSTSTPTVAELATFDFAGRTIRVMFDGIARDLIREVCSLDLAREISDDPEKLTDRLLTDRVLLAAMLRAGAWHDSLDGGDLFSFVAEADNPTRARLYSTAVLALAAAYPSDGYLKIHAARMPEFVARTDGTWF